MKYCPYCGEEAKQVKEEYGIFYCLHEHQEYPDKNVMLLFITDDETTITKIIRV